MKAFEIPYNFDKQLIKYLIKFDPVGELYHSIYIPPYHEDYHAAKKFYIHPDGKDMRNQQIISREEYESHVNLIRQYYPTKLMLLLQQNDICIDVNLLKYYINLGFTKFCVGNVKQAQMIRNVLPNSEIIGSITMKIMPQELYEDKYKIFDGFVLYFPYNRKLSVIKTLPQNYKYILLVNCDCNIYCPGTHHWFASEEYEQQYSFCPNDNIHINDWTNRIRIEPQDLSIFEPYITYFKLQGREFTTDYLIMDIEKYIKNYPTEILDEEKYENKNYSFDFYKKI